jgi:hypothetical protein
MLQTKLHIVQIRDLLEWWHIYHRNDRYNWYYRRGSHNCNHWFHWYNWRTYNRLHRNNWDNK